MDAGGRATPGAVAEGEGERVGEAAAWMHDSRDGGGRTVPGATVEEVERPAVEVSLPLASVLQALDPARVQHVGDAVKTRGPLRQADQHLRGPLHTRGRQGAGNFAGAGARPGAHQLRSHFCVALEPEAFADDECLIAAVATL